MSFSVCQVSHISGENVAEVVKVQMLELKRLFEVIITGGGGGAYMTVPLILSSAHSTQNRHKSYYSVNVTRGHLRP
jgi:hypothetical protein